MTAPPQSQDDWNRHWHRYASSASQNPAQAYRRMLIFRELELNRAAFPIKVLEIGCGQGDLSSEIKHAHPGVELVGLDLSHTGVEIARQKVPDGTFFQWDLMQPVPVPESHRNWATHAVCSEVLEHLDEPLVALRNAREWLAPGARLVVTVPAGPRSAFDIHIGHRRHFTPERLEELLVSAGFEVQTLHGAGFPFFNLYRLSVIARGKKLIEDASGTGELPLTARAAMRAFSLLFRMNRIESRRGWQLVATAVAPHEQKPRTAHSA
ncbi:MAG TPA: class I SAM-dependent methyltransferase [Polyangiaceae bacterium]